MPNTPSGRLGKKKQTPSFVSAQTSKKAFLYASSTTSSRNFNAKRRPHFPQQLMQPGP
ncbi:hypothetical protein M407DRAFT_244743 [Tulasnella calospora MUT 4182]|uniref:Uncharacterized protein n=1 Tax=Tulasnella calospora MUT 4182 TaxID=1051891 RepID=A0A0C3QEL6_9AGAM|nr:hypothetical protein M407DRAFT_244743 [Tulasnella calospora MUT 4182]